MRRLRISEYTAGALVLLSDDKVVSVETGCLSRKPRHQCSSTQPLETVRSHIASPDARERIHRLQVRPLTLRWVSFCFFAHSSPSIHHRSLEVSCSTLIEKTLPSLVPLINACYPLQGHAVLLTTTRRSSHPRQLVTHLWQVVLGCTCLRNHPSALKAQDEVRIYSLSLHRQHSSC